MEAVRDQNRVTGLLAETNDSNRTPTPLVVDPITDRLLTTATVSNTVDVQIVDGYGNEVEATMLNQLKVAESNRLAGGVFNVINDGDNPDSNYYLVSTQIGGATATVTSSTLTVATTTTTGSAREVTTNSVARYMGANSNYYRGVLKLNAGAVNNVRRIGASNGNNPTTGLFFQLNGTSFQIVSRKGNTDIPINNGSFNGDGTKVNQSYSLDTLYHTFEIYYTNKRKMFVIDGTPIHTIVNTTTKACDTLHLKPYLSNINTGVGSVCTIDCDVMTISRLGVISSQPKAVNLTSGSTLLKIGPGFLHQIDINSLDSKIITVYDGTSNAGTTIGIVDTNKANIGPILTNIPFNNGLYITLSGATNITIVYE